MGSVTASSYHAGLFHAMRGSGSSNIPLLSRRDQDRFQNCYGVYEIP